MGMFKRRSNLSVHERTHTGEAPLRCDLCAVNFKRNHHLGAHLKTLNHSNRLKLLQAEGVQIPDKITSIVADGKKEPKMKSSLVKKSLQQQQQVQVLVHSQNHPPHVQLDQSQGQAHPQLCAEQIYMEVV